MSRYRWRTPTRRGAWRPTREEAAEEAIRAGEASRDPHTGQLYWNVLAEIEADD